METKCTFELGRADVLLSEASRSRSFEFTAAGISWVLVFSPCGAAGKRAQLCLHVENCGAAGFPVVALIAHRLATSADAGTGCFSAVAATAFKNSGSFWTEADASLATLCSDMGAPSQCANVFLVLSIELLPRDMATLVAGPDFKVIVPSAVVSSESAVLRKMLSSAFLEARQQTIDLSGCVTNSMVCSGAALKAFVRWFERPVPAPQQHQQSIDEQLGLLQLADLYDVPRLHADADACCAKLLTVGRLAECLLVAEAANAPKLRSACVALIIDQPHASVTLELVEALGPEICHNLLLSLARYSHQAPFFFF